MYASDTQLLDYTVSVVGNGGKQFIACNSKTRAKAIKHVLENRYGDRIRVKIITSPSPMTILAASPRNAKTAAILFVLGIGAYFYLRTILDHANQGDSTPLMYLIASGLPFSVYWAIQMTRRLHKARSTRGVTACDRLRARNRLIGECASTIAVIGTTFSLVSAYQSFDTANASAHEHVWFMALPIMQQATSPQFCNANIYLRDRLCPEMMQSMSDLGNLYFGIKRKGGGETSADALIEDLTIKSQVLGRHLPGDLAVRLSDAIDRLQRTVPNELAHHFVAIVVYELVWAAAVIAAAHKLSVAAYDARVRFRFGQRVRKIWRDTRKMLRFDREQVN